MVFIIDKNCSTNHDPIEETKKMLKIKKDIAICTIVTDYIQLTELETLLNELELDYDVECVKSTFKITTIKGNPKKDFNIKKDFLLYLDKNYIGSNNFLGKELIVNYFKHLLISNLIPKYIIFINEAVFLVDSNSEVFKELCELNEKGTDFLICNNSISFFCIDYNKNMFKLVTFEDIINIQMNSDKIIKI